MRLVVLREIPEDPNLRREWNTLVLLSAKPQVFYTYEWALAMQRAYRETLHPLLFLGYDEHDSLRGVVALAVDASDRVSFLCATTGDYCDFLSTPECKAAFLCAILAELKNRRLRRITLTNLPADSDTVAALRVCARRSRYQFFARRAYECAQVSLANLERRPGGKQPVLPRKKMLRRFLNAMGRETPVRLDHARSWDAVEPFLVSFMQAHIARFLVTGRISNMARPERRVFLVELAKLLSQSGWLTLTRMMSGQTAFAWNYGFQFQGTWFWYQPTFDSSLEKYSPGFCLLAKLIEEAADDGGTKTVDLGLGAEEYKERFANQTRETLYVTLRASRSEHTREIVRYQVSRLIATSSGLERRVRAVRDRLQHVSKEIRSSGIAATTARYAKRLDAILWSESEVRFFDASDLVVPEIGEKKLEVLNLDHLASAASHYFDDEATLRYLLRSGKRLREAQSEGFVLVNENGTCLHFAWMTAFEGFFLAELNAKVNAQDPDCVLLFDCWTPVAARGRGYYGQSVGLITRLIRERGKQTWIFSAAENVASIRGLEKAGLRCRYSLIRQRVLGWQRIKGPMPALTETPAGAEVSARV